MALRKLRLAVATSVALLLPTGASAISCSDSDADAATVKLLSVLAQEHYPKAYIDSFDFSTSRGFCDGEELCFAQVTTRNAVSEPLFGEDQMTITVQLACHVVNNERKWSLVDISLTLRTTVFD